jgi:hypothetical protein
MRSILLTLALAITTLGAAIANNPSANTIWQPEVGTKYQMILTGVVDPTVKTLQPDAPIYDIDLFYHPKSTIDWLHDQGKKVICYFDAGSAEDWYFRLLLLKSLSNCLIGAPIMATLPQSTRDLVTLAGPVNVG